MPDSPHHSPAKPSSAVPAEPQNNVVPLHPQANVPHKTYDPWTVYPPTYMSPRATH